MRPLADRRSRWSRRTVLALGLSQVLPAARDTTFPPEWRRYADPATDLEVLRLTQPEHTSLLPASYNRPFSRRGTFLLYACDRSGAMQAHRLDLKSGEIRALTEARSLDPETLMLAPNDRSFYFFDGATLRAASFDNARTRDLYTVPAGWSRCAGAHLSSDGQRVLFGEQQGSVSRLRTVTTGRGVPATIVEAAFVMSHPVANPRRAQVLYREGDKALWVAHLDGKQNRKLRTAEGAAGPARWSPDGNAVLYLHFPSEPGQLNALREHVPDENTDKLLARTSQFVDFGINKDASVFVGASRNKAAPHVLILLRVTRRELTICEHAASDPNSVSPVFSPDSQRVLFQSDRHGKSALYAMRVDRFVELTDDDP